MQAGTEIGRPGECLRVFQAVGSGNAAKTSEHPLRTEKTRQTEGEGEAKGRRGAAYGGEDLCL